MSESESVQPTAPEAASEAAAPSIREIAAAAYDKINAAPEGEAPEVETPSEGPVRDERGRFASKVSEGQTPAETQTEQATETPAIEMPSAWSAQHAERWKTLPREVQEHIAAREAEVHKAISEKGQEVARYRWLDEALHPYRSAMAAHGQTEQQLIPALFAIRQQLMDNPAQTLAELARAFRVDLSTLAGQPQQDPQQWVDPQVADLHQRIASLENMTAQQKQAAFQAEVRTMSQQIETFAKDKPDFPLVRKLMGRLMEDDESKTMEQAYEEARLMVPEARNQLLEQERKAAVERYQAEQRQKAEEAKRAAAVNVRGRGEQTASAPRSMRETIAASYDRVANA